MKKYITVFRCFEIDVYADTQEEARKRAIAGFTAMLDNELSVAEMKTRTERCDGCRYTFEQVIKADTQQLCSSCYEDRYDPLGFDLRDIEIPF